MKIIKAKQGTPEWHAHRANTRNASDAPAVMGVSPYKSRAALIREKATGIVPEVSPELQRRFDKGHATEAAARLIVEEDMGITLYPLVATDDDGYLGASSDGCTLPPKGGMGFEHKLWNADLAESVRNGIVPESHAWQLDQQIAVFEFDCILFVVSDGTAENMVSCEYRTTPERIAALMDGWEQFDADVAAYVPSEVAEMPKADVTVELPALFVHAKGEITTHNMDEFGKALSSKLAETRAIVLVTDQDFSNAKDAAKKFRETAKAIALSKEQMLAQTETIGEAARKMDAWAADLNATALQLEKDVKREDLAKKETMILAAKDKYADYVAALEAETKPIRLALVAPNFAEAIKGKSKYSNMQEAVDAMLSAAKMDATAAAKDVRSKLAWYKENAASHSALFHDLQQIIVKPMDDFTLIITSRIDKAKTEETARLEAEREKIRKEEADKLAKEAADKAEYERQQAEKQEAAKQHDAEAAKPSIQAATPSPASAPVLHAVAPVSTKKDPSAFAAEIFDDMCTMTYAELEIMGHARDRVLALRSGQTAAA